MAPRQRGSHDRPSGSTSEPEAAARRDALLVIVAANLYHVGFEGATGRTPGKGAPGIRVVRSDGTPCTFRAATIRTLARFLDFLPFGYLVAFCTMSMTARRQRLGDLLGGTVVIREGVRA